MSYGYNDPNLGYAPPNSTTSIISLVAGILGLTFVPTIGSIIALITGYMARREIQDSSGTIGGAGLATAGIVLGWIGIALSLIGLCVVGFVFLLPLCLIPLGLSADQFNSLLQFLWI